MKKKDSAHSSLRGNKYGIKLKDSDTRQDAFRQYCDHLASGFPKECFFFSHPTESVCWKTMERYIKENPEEFPAILIEKAKAERYKHWLSEGQALMKGCYRSGSPIVWQTIMRNIFKEIGWDKPDKNEGTIDNPALDALGRFFANIPKHTNEVTGPKNQGEKTELLEKHSPFDSEF